MKKIEVSDEVYAALARLAQQSQCTPDEVLASLLRPSTVAAPESIAAFVASAEFQAQANPDDRYLALLGWVATRHAAEFREFIPSLASGRRYLGFSRDAVLETCRHHQARQIGSTQYWAILNIDPASKRRFLVRLLDFVGYREDVAGFVCGMLGDAAHPGRRFAA